MHLSVDQFRKVARCHANSSCKHMIVANQIVTKCMSFIATGGIRISSPPLLSIMSTATSTAIPHATRPSQKKARSLANLGIGAVIQVFEVSTLGQPFEVIKTQMAAHRGEGLVTAIKRTHQRGGMAGFYQGLIPWAWIEASTKGAVLLYVSS